MGPVQVGDGFCGKGAWKRHRVLSGMRRSLQSILIGSVWLLHLQALRVILLMPQFRGSAL